MARGYRRTIVMGNGTELTSLAMGLAAIVYDTARAPDSIGVCHADGPVLAANHPRAIADYVKFND